MSDPLIWATILADPTLPFDRETLRLALRDQRRWSRSWLYPVIRVLSRVTVTFILVAKRLVPWRLSAHSAMDSACVWFLRRFVSVEAAVLLIRHFIVETNLLNFILHNWVGPAARRVTLMPTTLGELGSRAIIQHDLNVYDALLTLGTANREPAGPQDFSMLEVPPIDPERGARRLLHLDIQTALCLLNILFAVCLTRDEYRRAVHSLRLDESVLAILADLTGDVTFRCWRPTGFLVRVDSTIDVPRAVYEHAIICEYAHAHLLTLARRQSG